MEGERESHRSVDVRSTRGTRNRVRIDRAAKAEHCARGRHSRRCGSCVPLRGADRVVVPCRAARSGTRARPPDVADAAVPRAAHARRSGGTRSRRFCANAVLQHAASRCTSHQHAVDAHGRDRVATQLDCTGGGPHESIRPGVELAQAVELADGCAQWNTCHVECRRRAPRLRHDGDAGGCADAERADRRGGTDRRDCVSRNGDRGPDG